MQKNKGCKTVGVRLYGERDIRLEEFELPPYGDGEVLLRVVSDSLCASTYKAVKQGASHKRVPPDIAENPVIIGHELCGEIIGVGARYADRFQVGDRAVLQPALKLESGYDPGYSYPTVGGSTVYAVVPEIVLERGCLIPYHGDSFFKGSLVECLACDLRGLKGLYHTDYETYSRSDDEKRGGKLAILGGAGPMGIGLVDLVVGRGRAAEVTVTDLDEERLAFARRSCSPEAALARGVKVNYVNTSGVTDVAAYLKELSGGGFDDVFVMVPVPELFTMAEEISREDGCINFFAGPPVHEMAGALNLYRVHYDGIHVVGTAGSIPSDMEEVISYIEEQRIEPACLVSHILGLRAVPEAIYAMETPCGAKKVCYNEIDIPLIAIADLPRLGESDPFYRALAEIVAKNGGLWCAEAERYLLANGPKIMQ